ncbi:MAG TPA: ATP synthase F1 subunit delta [Pirellulales bacterium]|jgi:F-type H+-transporting ATPase subunit delta
MVDSKATPSADGSHRVDPASQQVATIYAKALLAATAASGQSGAALDELSAIQRDVFQAYPKLSEILASAFIDVDEKLGILDRTFGGRVSPVVMNFLKVLAKHDRLAVLKDLIQVARDLYIKQQGQLSVEVTTATPLSDSQTAQIQQQLRALLGAEPVLSPQIKPELIGGVVLRVGDTVYDGSVAAQLADMRGRIINRSVHEIQSRRDRFSNSAGN